MATSPETLPRYNAPKAERYERSARVLAWAVYLTLGFLARLSLLVLWIFTDLVDDAFGNWIIPAVGFVLVPFASLRPDRRGRAPKDPRCTVTRGNSPRQILLRVCTAGPYTDEHAEKYAGRSLPRAGDER